MCYSIFLVRDHMDIFDWLNSQIFTKDHNRDIHVQQVSFNVLF